MSNIDNSDFAQMERTVKQACELTYYLEKAAKEAYEEDDCLTDIAVKILGVKYLIEKELLFALDKIKSIKLDNKE